MILRLTDYETGEPVYVRKDAIIVCRGLRAFVHAPIGDGHAQEEGFRTRIEVETGDCLLVRETPDEVMRERESKSEDN